MRTYWLTALETIAMPVLAAAAKDALRETMPVYKGRDKSHCLEALGRIVCGIAPWLEIPMDATEEGKLRERYKGLTIKSIGNLVHPQAGDYMDFAAERQGLVDAAYLCQGLIRAPRLWDALEQEVQKNVLIEVKKTRQIIPTNNNWLLFASMIEAFLLKYDNVCDTKRLYKGVKTFINRYYIGDGFYGDGAHFAMDHYNSYVIHPMLTDILQVMQGHGLNNAHAYFQKQVPRFQRYVAIQERMISPEGAYPLFGRTLICRFGAFHALAQAAFLELIPNNIAGSQVRCALHAVLKRHMETSGNFDAQGFLSIGFNGEQEQMAESYVSSGSPYHCCTLFLPLGLPETHPFWADKDKDWTAVKAFKGDAFPADTTYVESNPMKERFMPWLYKCQSGWRKLKSLLK
ncbi:DUF2264 domain-containing protein [Mariniflexile sp.]|uniref:DUF2264 domain-containing protein n=1 Tax=Mariniflexile sp. TaxID=1979402 RepID=UPI00356928DB